MSRCALVIARYPSSNPATARALFASFLWPPPPLRTVKNCASAHPASRGARARTSRPPSRRRHPLPPAPQRVRLRAARALNGALEVEPPAESDVLNADVGAVLWYSVVVDFLHHLIFTPIGDAFPGIGAHRLGGGRVVLDPFFAAARSRRLIFQKHMCRGAAASASAAATSGRAKARSPATTTSSRKWWAYVDDESLVAGQAPLSIADQELESLGVKAIINLCDEFKGPARTYRKKKMTLLARPSTTWSPPSRRCTPRAPSSNTARMAPASTSTANRARPLGGGGDGVAPPPQADDPPRGQDPLDAQGAPSSADAPAHPADAPSGRPLPAPAAAAAPAAPNQRRAAAITGAPAVEAAELSPSTRGEPRHRRRRRPRGWPRRRAESDACSRRRRVPAARGAAGSRRPSIDTCVRRCAAARRGPARCPSLAWTQPPNWSNQQPGGVGEAERRADGPRTRRGPRAVEGGPKKRQEQLGTSGGLVSTQL